MATQPTDVEEDAESVAVEAGLRYVSDAQPGIRRVRRGRGFSYRRADGSPVTDERTLSRIRSLAVPPAWNDVWICASGRGHIQASGRDARGRKQYRYHPRWRVVRDESKFHRLVAFGEALPRIRTQVEKDLALHGLPRERVLATVVRLLDITRLRVGNEEYARANASHGLTTLRDRHAEVRATSVTFHFAGKGGKEVELDVRDRRLSRIVGRCRDLPGYELFQYVDEEGTARPVDSGDVNAYLRAAACADFSAKDFRTWSATVLAATALRDAGPASSERQAQRFVRRAIEEVAGALGNTPAVARKSYVHPAVVDAYLAGRTIADYSSRGSPRLEREERATLALLRCAEAEAAA